jgi:malic enzyme
MGEDAIVRFGAANPDPRRSTFRGGPAAIANRRVADRTLLGTTPYQINNVLAFPGVLSRGLLDARPSASNHRIPTPASWPPREAIAGTRGATSALNAN